MNEQVPSKDVVYEVADTPEAKTAIAIAFLEQFRDGRIEAAKAARQKISILGPPETLEVEAAIFAHAVETLRAYEGITIELKRYKQALQRANGFLIMHELEPVKLDYSTHEPPAVPARVRLLKDIYDDGQDHHPPGYIAKRGEIVEVREVRALAVAHEGVTDSAFVVRASEFEPVPTQPPEARPFAYQCNRRSDGKSFGLFYADEAEYEINQAEYDITPLYMEPGVSAPPPGACTCLSVINTLIKPGDLQGNGCDETAQRNGVILAFNAVAEHQRSALTKPDEQP